MKLKKVLSLLLAVAMVLGTITIPAFAEESTPTDNVVAEISGTPYTSLQAAIEGANFGDTITVTGNIKDEAVIVNKSVTITSNAADADSKPTLNNVSIKADGAEVELIVSNLKFTGTSYINANNAKALTVDKVDANVTLNKADSVTNSRAAFISLGASELTTPLKLTVTNNNIVVTGDYFPDPILGWRYIADGSVISYNTFGSEETRHNDTVKLLNVMNGATITLENNIAYCREGSGNGFAFGQNCSRDNSYTVVISGNTFYGNADFVWVEVSGASTTHATIKATSTNTVITDGETRNFEVGDLKMSSKITTMTSYAGIDVVTDANGNVTSGTLTESSNTNVIAVGATVTIGETPYIKNSEGNLIKAVPAADLTYAGYVGTSGEGDTYRENIQVDLYDVYATQSLVVELWSGNTKLSTTSLREADRDDETAKLFPVIGTITANIVVKGKLSGSWDTEWHIAPSAAYLPDTIKVYADGVSEPVATWNGGFSDADEEKYLALTGVAKGTEENPYIIDSLEALKAFRDKVDEQKADGSSQFAGKYVKLTTDIDLEGENWEPIGSMTGDHGSFTGVFDGDGHTISNLNVQGAGNGQGFFARTSGNAEIKNLKFNNVTVKSTDNSNYVGGVVGNAYANTKITNVHVTGTIDIAGRGYIGGIAGHGYVVMDNVSVVGEGTISSTFWCAGGILGYGGEGTTNITNSTVEGTGNGLVIKSAAGGLGSIVGMAEDNNGTQPISGSNLSAKNVKIQTYVGDFGTSYAEYSLGYLYGGNPSQLTGNLTVDDVTFDAQGNTSPSVADIVASVDGLCYQSLEDALEAAKDKEDIVIELLADASLDITAWQTLAIGGDNTKTITINGNEHTLTFNQLDSDWNNVATKNGAKLILNDMAITNSGHNDGPWNRHDINFACDVELNNVTSDKALAFKAGAALDEVTVTETGDVYAIWIQANGQEVTISNSTIVAQNGRGIKIADEYVDADELGLVNLTISNTTFDTAKKSAVLVTSTAGADITASNVDISKVAADTVNLVWVDAEREAYQHLVTVTGGTKYLEDQKVQMGDMYYTSLQNAIAAAEGGETITLLDDITTASTVTIDKNVIIDLSGKTLTGNVYINEGATVEIKNGTIICKDGRYDTINSFGTLTLTDVNADGERHIVRAKKGSLTINGGTYKYTGSATGTRNTINIGDYDNGTIVSSANVIINSGTFIGPKGTSADSGAAVSVQAGSTVTINGGKFTNGKNNTLGAQDGATLTVKGGLFDQNPAAYVAEDSTTFKDNGTSYWVVLAASSHSIAMSVDSEDATYYGGETITVSVAVNGGDYAISDWVLTYDAAKVTYTDTVQLEKDSKTPVVDATTGTITEENYSTSSWGNLFADGSVVTYTFTVNTPIADTTALFAITNATVTTAAATPFGKTPVGDERVEVSIKLRDFGEVTTLDNGTAFTDAPHNIAFDNTAHEITVDVADVDGESVEYTYTKDGKEVNEIKAAGTYEVAYEITKPGYNPSTGTITVVIGNPEYVLETSIYTIGDHTLVMLYTNTDGMYPVYNDDAMLDISASGYKYQETAESTPVEYDYVYGIVIPSTTKTIDELKAAITFNTTKPFAIDPYDEDVNFVSPIDSSDIVFTLNVYGDYADVHDKYELLSRILKADVDRDGTNAKKVDVFDVTAIERAIYGK